MNTRSRLFMAITAGGIGVAALVSFLIMRPGTDTSAPAFVGEQRHVPALEFTDMAGAVVRLADFAGTPLVINTWATWCPFCLKELPDFAAIQKEFGSGVNIIAINRAESAATVVAYIAEHGITQDKLLFLLDPKDIWYQDIGGFSMPETVFVDREGFIRAHVRGPMEQEEMRRRIQGIINTTIQ